MSTAPELTFESALMALTTESSPEKDIDTMTQAEMQKEHAVLRKHLKGMEKAFKIQHGREISNAEIKTISYLRGKHSRYNKLKDRLGRRTLPELDPYEEKRRLAAKRKRDEERDRERSRKRRRDEDKENQAPPSSSSQGSSEKRHKKRDTINGRFRPNSVYPERRWPQANTVTHHTPNKDAPRDGKGRFKSSGRARRARTDNDQLVPQYEGDSDAEYRPEAASTFVAATPKRNGHALGLFDMDTPQSVRRRCGDMELRDRNKVGSYRAQTQTTDGSERLPTSTGAAAVRVIVPSRAHSEDRLFSSNMTLPMTMSEVAASTPSKDRGKGRASNFLPEATPSNPHRHGKTPPSTGRRYALQQVLNVSLPSYMASVSKRKYDVVDLTDAGIDPTKCGIAAGSKGMLTPRSKPTSSSPSKPVACDEFETPSFLRTQPFRIPRHFDLGSVVEDEELSSSALLNAGTPSRPRSKSMSARLSTSFAANFKPGKLRPTKSFTQLWREADGRADDELDEQEAAMDEYMAEQDALTFNDTEHEEEEAAQGSSGNPFNRRKAPKRQTRKSNLKPKPAVAHNVRAQTTADDDGDESGTFTFHGSVEEDESKSKVSTGKVRGEPERKRRRSPAPTVDSCRVAKQSVETASILPGFDDIEQAESSTTQQDRANKRAMLEAMRQELDQLSEDELFMANKPSSSTAHEPKTKKMTKQRNQFGAVIGGNVEKAADKTKHHLATNFQRHKNLSRGEGKKKMEQKKRARERKRGEKPVYMHGQKVRTEPVEDTGTRESPYPRRGCGKR